MKTPDEIKRGAELCSRFDGRDVCDECPYNGLRRKGTCIDAMEADCLAYIRQLEERVAELEKPLKPMTWEEAMMDDFYLEMRDGAYLDNALNEFAVDMPDDGHIIMTVHNHDGLRLERDDYGKTWRCWSRRPTDEERKAAEWDD